MHEAEPLAPLAQVLAAHGLTGATETPLDADGWSGARLTRVARGSRRYVLKRDALAWDWIARSTRDGPLLREGWFAANGPRLPGRFTAPYLGVGRDGDAVAILMPDLSDVLFAWESPVDAASVGRVLEALAELHAHDWSALERLEGAPWTPLRERLFLLSPRSAAAYAADGVDAGRRFLDGWSAFERQAPAAARELIAWLDHEPGPLLEALDAQGRTLLHGDLKLANVGIAADGSLPLIDWQMVMLGPVALELGWFLVSNVASLPWPPEETLRRYVAALDAVRGRARSEDPDDDRRTSDVRVGDGLVWIVGLLLRGWRKGLDAEAGVTYPWGGDGASDLAWWCDQAVEAAEALGIRR